MKPVLIQAELTTVTVDEIEKTVPDLGTLSESTQRTGPDLYAAQWRTGNKVHFFTVQKLPNQIAGKTWWFGSGDPEIVGALMAAGVSASAIKVNPPPPQRQDFIDAGAKVIKRASDGQVVALAPPVVMAGQSPITVGLNGSEEEGETYSIEDQP